MHIPLMSLTKINAVGLLRLEYGGINFKMPFVLVEKERRTWAFIMIPNVTSCVCPFPHNNHNKHMSFSPV
jgi:hypothetical protein